MENNTREVTWKAVFESQEQVMQKVIRLEEQLNVHYQKIDDLLMSVHNRIDMLDERIARK